MNTSATPPASDALRAHSDRMAAIVEDIGTATVAVLGALAAAGARVALAARRTDLLEEVRGGIEAAGGTATTIAMDVAPFCGTAVKFQSVVIIQTG